MPCRRRGRRTSCCDQQGRLFELGKRSSSARSFGDARARQGEIYCMGQCLPAAQAASRLAVGVSDWISFFFFFYSQKGRVVRRSVREETSSLHILMYFTLRCSRKSALRRAVVLGSIGNFNFSQSENLLGTRNNNDITRPVSHWTRSRASLNHHSHPRRCMPQALTTGRILDVTD